MESPSPSSGHPDSLPGTPPGSDSKTPSTSARSTLTSLLGLVAGLVAGSFIRASSVQELHTLAELLEPLGVVWIRALQMVILPLVISSLMVTLTSGSRVEAGRLGAWSLLVFFSLLVLAAAFVLIVAPFPIQAVLIDPDTLAAIKPMIPEATQQAAQRGLQATDISSWVVSLVPTNFVAALANGEYLQIIVVTLIFGLAVGRIESRHRERVAHLFEALSAATLVVLRVILRFTAPAVFCIALALARQSGFELGEILVAYLLILIGFLVVFTAFVYLLGMGLSGVSPRAYCAALLPAQTVAVSTRSSLATLPLLIEKGRTDLSLPPRITAFVLPLCASTLKVNRTISAPMKVLFLSHVYGIDLELTQIMTFVTTVMILSVAAVGIPGTSAPVRTVPAYLAVGIPLEGVVLLKTAEVIPDIFKTLLNSTTYMTAALLVFRLARTDATAEESLAES